MKAPETWKKEDRQGWKVEINLIYYAISFCILHPPMGASSLSHQVTLIG